MKHNIEELLNAHIYDNRKYIESFSADGNIKEYLRYDYKNMDAGYSWYLTDDEIQAWHRSYEEAERLMNEVEKLMDLYDIPISTFMLVRKWLP